MRLPLAYELEGGRTVSAYSSSPYGSSSSSKSPGEFVYVPWDGPSSSYLPVSMVTVLRPGRREAGLMTSKAKSKINPDLSIVTVFTEDEEKEEGMSAAGQDTGSMGGNGNGKGGNGTGSNGNGNGKSVK